MKGFFFVCTTLILLSGILAQIDYEDSDMRVSCGASWNHGTQLGDPTYRECEPILDYLACGDQTTACNTDVFTEFTPNEYSGGKGYNYFVLLISKTCQITRRIYGATDAGPASYHSDDIFFLGNFVFYTCVNSDPITDV